MRVADLYCGGGGFSAGFKMAGFDIVYGVDIDKNACDTFKHNFKDAQVDQMDILDLDYRELPKFDVLIGSPPCVDFSVGNIDRGFDLTHVRLMLDFVEKTKPKYWVMENVPQIMTMEFALNLRFYFPNIQILEAFRFGAPTVRKRFFGGKYPKIAIPPNYAVVKDYININRSGHRQPYKDHVYRKINPNKPLFTICAQRISNDRYLLPNGSSLSVCEYATLQGFPDWFVFPVSRSMAQRQVGNSVCPPVAAAIGKAIMHDHDGTEDEPDYAEVSANSITKRMEAGESG